jgi:hypothetical protein
LIKEALAVHHVLSGVFLLTCGEIVSDSGHADADFWSSSRFQSTSFSLSCGHSSSWLLSEFVRPMDVFELPVYCVNNVLRGSDHATYSLGECSS